MSNVVSRLLNWSRVPTQPDASIAPGLAPLSQTLVGPVQHVLNIWVIPGNTELQSPGCGACAVAASCSILVLEMRGPAGADRGTRRQVHGPVHEGVANDMRLLWLRRDEHDGLRADGAAVESGAVRERAPKRRRARH